MYGRRTIDEHLGDGTTYRPISDTMAHALHCGFMYKFEGFYSTYYTIPLEDMRRGRAPKVMPISHAEATFLLRAGQTRTLSHDPKIHKTPWVMIGANG